MFGWPPPCPTPPGAGPGLRAGTGGFRRCVPFLVAVVTFFAGVVDMFTGGAFFDVDEPFGGDVASPGLAVLALASALGRLPAGAFTG